ncbi:MAG: cation:proton antiporter subunit C [Luteococcus japonicus]
MALALSVAVLLGGGTYMVLRRGMLRLVVGFVMITHAVNLLIVLAGNPRRREAPIGQDFDRATTADPLVQALVLTAIVISFAITVLLLTLAVVGDGDDDTEIDLTDDELDMPDLLEEEAIRRPHRRYPASDWHAYLDRTEDER